VSAPPETALFVGRLHPVFVHLPIGFIVLLAVLEVLARFPRFRHANANVGLILALAVPMAAFTAFCGWLLSLAGGYDDSLLQWHKWTGIGTAAACLLVGLLYRLDFKKSYRWCLFATTAALAVASHLGGSLTHGSDYLTQYIPASLRSLLGSTAAPKPAVTKPKDFADLPAFTGVIQPVLQKDCVACHGPEKAKGDLRLDSLQALLKGSKNGPVVVPGKSATSELFTRLNLPPESDDHMPPDGKPQPSEEDIALLQWWLDAGAPADKLVRDLKPPANVSRILAARFGAGAAPAPVAAAAVAPKPLQAALPLAAKTAEELGIVLCALSATEPWLQCNASIAGTNFGDSELAKLAPLGPNVRWLDLAGTAVTDAGLAKLSALPNLTRLHLERTAITDAALPGLAGLPNLEYLNLYATAVTDAGLEPLQKMPKLKQLYLWQTKVTPAAAKAFAEAHLDKAQLARWQAELEQLQAKIRDQQITLDLGAVTAAAATNAVAATNPAPVNASCPVSGKPVDLTKTVLHEGALIAFCCDDCKAKFQKDPKPYLAKLALNSKAPDPTTTKTK
jgi:uncharacterized membrane protein/YHS domain-containing protein